MKKIFKLKKVDTTSLLSLVKTIKYTCSLGLKEVKDLIYKVKDGEGPISLELNLDNEEEKKFLKELSEIDGIEYSYPTTNTIRKIKFHQLGLIEDKQELIDIIKEFSSIDEILNHLPIEVLSDMIIKLNPYVQNNI